MTNGFNRTHYKGQVPTHSVTRIGSNGRRDAIYRGSLESCENWLELIVVGNPMVSSVSRSENGIKTETHGGTESFYFIREN